MKALIYVLKRTIINYVKRLKEKPQKAIGPIFVVIWLFLMFLPKKKSTSTEIPVDIFVSIFLIITIAIVLYSLYS